VITRAFAPLNKILEVAGHLVKEKGCLLAMKGVNVATELKKIPSGFFLKEDIKIMYPGCEQPQHLIVINRQ
jgi:16S rRNA G527 N7-methylase RsmG